MQGLGSLQKGQKAVEAAAAVAVRQGWPRLAWRGAGRRLDLNSRWCWWWSPSLSPFLCMKIKFYTDWRLFHRRKRLRLEHHDAQCMYQSSNCTVCDFGGKYIVNLKLYSLKTLVKYCMKIKFYTDWRLCHRRKRLRLEHHDAQCMYQSSKCTVCDFVGK